MSDLADIAHALDAFDTDLADIEQRAKAHDQRAEQHEKDDALRFLKVNSRVEELHAKADFLGDYLNLIHDQMIAGFRELGAKIIKRDPNEITPRVRGGSNGH